MLRTKHVIWDWNGTLVNDAPLTCEILNVMLSRRSLRTVSLEEYRQIYCHPVQRIYEHFGFDFSKESFESLAHEWHVEYVEKLRNVQLHCDTMFALEHMQSVGAIQTVLSALPHDILCESIRINNVGSFFSYVHGLEDNLGRSKIENGRLLMERIGVSQDDTILIGDSSHDFETATALGVRCFLVSRGLEDRQRLLKHKVDVFGSFAGLMSCLED